MDVDLGDESEAEANFSFHEGQSCARGWKRPVSSIWMWRAVMNRENSYIIYLSK
jgi:hypothetical protein